MARSHVCALLSMTRDKIVKEKYSAVLNSAVGDKNRRIAEIKTPQKLLAIRYYTFGLLLWPSNSEEVVLWRRALIDLLWPCPGSTTVRIWPKSQYKCAGVMSTPKCL